MEKEMEAIPQLTEEPTFKDARLLREQERKTRNSQMFAHLRYGGEIREPQSTTPTTTTPFDADNRGDRATEIALMLACRLSRRLFLPNATTSMISLPSYLVSCTLYEYAFEHLFEQSTLSLRTHHSPIYTRLHRVPI